MDLLFVPDASHQPVIHHQRTTGAGTIDVLGADHNPGQTRLGRLFQKGAANIRLPRPFDPAAGHLDAVLINTAGGLTDRDSLDWRIHVGTKSALSVTTQAAEKIYKGMGPPATVTVGLRVDAGAQCAWVPQETILYHQSHLVRRIEADVSADASLLLAEVTVCGRTAYGEERPAFVFRDDWTVRQGEKLLHREASHLGTPGNPELFSSGAGLGPDGRAFATVLYVGPDTEAFAARTDARMHDLSAEVRIAHGRVTLPAGRKWLARLVGPTGDSVRRAVAVLLRGEAPPFVLPAMWTF